MKRLLQLNEPFSVLLVKWARAGKDSDDDDQPAKWLTRLKACLRDVDLIGQLADTLYVIVLPLAKRREAEALRRRVETELGPALAAQPVRCRDQGAKGSGRRSGWARRAQRA